MKSIILCMAIFLSVLNGSPKVVAKFGPSTCPWSEQLKKEIWNSSSLQALLDEASIQREEAESQDKEESLPVLVIFASDGEEIGRLGYLLISSEKYVDLIKEALSIHALSQSTAELDVQQLLHLYRKAHVLDMKKTEEKLLQEGVAKDTGVDFLIEQYAACAKTHPRKAQKVKREIRARKPHDAATEWEIALIAFQARKERLHDLSMIALPLEKFLRDFESSYPDYAWRCHLILAEFYKDKKLAEKTRFHARKAIQGAPNDLKETITIMGEEAS